MVSMANLAYLPCNFLKYFSYNTIHKKVIFSFLFSALHVLSEPFKKFTFSQKMKVSINDTVFNLKILHS